jgi:hypothetical protein
MGNFAEDRSAVPDYDTTVVVVAASCLTAEAVPKAAE